MNSKKKYESRKFSSSPSFIPPLTLLRPSLHKHQKTSATSLLTFNSQRTKNHPYYRPLLIQLLSFQSDVLRPTLCSSP